MGFMPASAARKLGSSRFKPHPSSMGGFSKAPGAYGGPIHHPKIFHATHTALKGAHR